MTVWLTRAGGHGEHEQKFLDEGRAYLTWDGLDVDVSKLGKREELSNVLTERYPEKKPKTIINWVSQIWPFAHDIEVGDMVVMPSKTQPSIYFGTVAGEYQFDASAPDPYFHWHVVEWEPDPIPRTRFGQDILHSFGSAMTICRVKRNNAEARLLTMKSNGWAAESIASAIDADASDEQDASEYANLEELAASQIAKLIEARFKGHELTRLVNSILVAEGYTTYVSPEGADGGADILAGLGPIGFGDPRICVEVKSEASPIGREAVDKLIGAMRKFHAEQGLFVSWSGFKNNVQKELAPQFFNVRLWTQTELLEHLFANYAKLDEDLQTRLPLRRVWTVAVPEEGSDD